MEPVRRSEILIDFPGHTSTLPGCNVCPGENAVTRVNFSSYGFDKLGFGAEPVTISMNLFGTPSIIDRKPLQSSGKARPGSDIGWRAQQTW